MPILKEDASREKLQVVDETTIKKQQQQDIINKLKSLLPQVVNGDNKINVEALKNLVEGVNIAGDGGYSQGYGLNFVGKAIARAEADSDGKKVLKLQSKQSKNSENTNNIVIRGDNLEVLKILKQNYQNKIKMIYIDPPYNTGNDDFVYKDNFKESDAELIEKNNFNEDAINYFDDIFKSKTHSSWLAFMYSRLKLARELLKEDGVIFISIDDNEQANLKILCDEIFGESNFVGDVIWNSTKSVTNTALLSCSHTYNFVYFKNKSYYIKHRNEFKLPDEGDNFSNPDNDPRGPWKADPFQVGGWRPNQQYEVINPKTGKIYKPNINCSWKNDYKKYLELIEDNRIVFGIRGDAGPQRKRFLFEAQDRGRVANTLWTQTDTTSNATVKLKTLFDNKLLFDNPKPTDLIKKFIMLGDFYKNGIILDFFAGSGTTGHAVMELNKERLLKGEEGNLKYILVQWDELIDSKKSSEAYKFCKENNFEPVISSITIERLNRAGEKIQVELLQESMKDSELLKEAPKIDIGYKVFSLEDKPQLVDYSGNYAMQHNIENSLDILYNMLVKTDMELHSSIKTIVADKIYIVARKEMAISNSCYIIANVTQNDIEKISNIKDKEIYINGYADISLESFLNLLHSYNINKDNIKIIY